MTLAAAALSLFAALAFSSCSTPTPQPEATSSAALSLDELYKDATIYEVNLRQYTPEGTLKAFQAHLPRLQKLGVKILWFMPVHPIGVEARKGTLGSYYSVKDYCAINPEFGTLADFKLMVTEAHRLGMSVIIDWVANHTSRDHAWVSAHPDWYVAGKDGKPIGPYDWSDVAQLNFASKDMQAEMARSMAFWLRECNIDGFRCDVAGLAREYVTEQQAVEFWEYARAVCDSVKQSFWLAEDEGLRALANKAFDANYAWECHHIMHQLAQGKENVNDLHKYFEKDALNFPKKFYRMNFTSNHDENSWKGSEYTRLGDAARTFAVLSVTIPGIPLIYSGQEVALRRSLEFFEKDVISWTDAENATPFYQTLTRLKKEYSALYNGSRGADMLWVKNSEGKKVLSFVREDDRSKVFCVFNLSPETLRNVEYQGNDFYGNYTELFSGVKVEIRQTPSNILNPWEYRIYTMKK